MDKLINTIIKLARQLGVRSLQEELMREMIREKNDYVVVSQITKIADGLVNKIKRKGK